MLEAQEQKLQNGFAFFFPKERQCFYTFHYGTQCDQLRTLEARIHCKVPINIRQINFVCFFLSSESYPIPSFLDYNNLWLLNITKNTRMNRQVLKIKGVMYKTNIFMKSLAKCRSVTTIECFIQEWSTSFAPKWVCTEHN